MCKCLNEKYLFAFEYMWLCVCWCECVGLTIFCGAARRDKKLLMKGNLYAYTNRPCRWVICYTESLHSVRLLNCLKMFNRYILIIKTASDVLGGCINAYSPFQIK